jgi:hypothetical protein
MILMENFIDAEVLKQVLVSLAACSAAWAVYYKVNFEKKKYLDKKLEEHEERVKTHISKTADKANIATSIIGVRDKNKNVKEHLGALMSYVKADQIWLGLFHNGQYTIGGEHLIKLTSLYELPEGGFTTSEGLRVSTNRLIDGLPLLHMGEWTQKNLDDEWFVRSVDDIESPLLKESFKEWELKQGVNVILYADEENTQPIAVIGLNWISEAFDIHKTLNVKTDKDAIRKLREMSSSLTYVIVN